MPPFKQTEARGLHLRLLLMGEAMTLKTTWISEAAEAGFNLIYIDGDGNAQPFKRLSSAAKDRVAYLEVMDLLGESCFAWAVTYIKRMEKFVWEEEGRKYVGIPSMASKTNSHFIFDPNKLSWNDILVFDSWTSYVRSLIKRYMKENGIDLDASAVVDGNWSDYNWTGKLADDFLGKMKEFPCHVVVVAHSEVWEKKDKKGNILQTKTKVISTSRNQAEKLPKDFTEILHFTLSGSNVFIEAKRSAEVLAGSRSLPPFRKKYDEFKFKHLMEALAIPSTGAPLEAIKFYGPGELPGLAKPKPTEVPSLKSGNVGAAVISPTPTAEQTLPVKRVFSLAKKAT